MKETRGALEEARRYFIKASGRLAEEAQTWDEESLTAAAAIFAAVAGALADPDPKTMRLMLHAVRVVGEARIQEIKNMGDVN